jgi:DNA replication and repair protein RecF
MYINKIEIKNFRNYEKQEIELNPHINIFYGDNAQGKTNILEAIFISGFGKSFRTSKEKEMIKLGEAFLEATVFYQKSDRDGKIRTVISNKKQIEVNGVKIKKLSELIGKINLVIFTPDDIQILKSGPEKRRRFLDMMIGQLRPKYVYILNLYLKTLEQRNNYLKQIKEENKPESMLEIWDEKLAEYAEIICKYRTEFIEKLNRKIKEIHSEVTSNSEEIKIEYITECNNREIYLQLLKQRRKLDIIKGYTTKGIHRDDFKCIINDKEIEVYGSQGQHRTAILSLKLAELYVIYDEIGEYPILLLDDFMSELDEKRRKSFLSYIKDTQVIITCTDKMKLDNLNEYKLFNVKNGKII